MPQIDADFEDVASGLQGSAVFSHYLSAMGCPACRCSGKLNISECQADMGIRKGVLLNKAAVRGGIIKPGPNGSSGFNQLRKKTL